MLHRTNRTFSTAYLIIAILLVFGAIGIIITTANDLGLGTVQSTTGLTDEETAYYEYVAPRLDRLVTEVDDVVVMVEDKSRDILALTISGNRIESLADEITGYGDSNGIPDRFATAHQRILTATETTNYTFDQAREALRTFNFSNMSGLVTDFKTAAAELHVAQDDFQAIAGGTNDAMYSHIDPVVPDVPGYARDDS